MFDDPCRCLTREIKSFSDHFVANSFTPWFKLIARDFLFGWWDELYKRRDSQGRVVAKNVAGIADGSKVFKMA